MSITPRTGPVPLDAQANRVAALRRYRILDTPHDPFFARIARLAAAACGTPMASVAFVDAERVWFAASVGLGDPAESRSEPGMCSSAVLTTGPYVVEDAAADPRTATHSMVVGEPGLRFYASQPVTTPDGQAIGTVNVEDVRPRTLDAARLAVLADLAAVVLDRLELRLASLDGAASSGLCELGGPVPCSRPAELKIADSWGDSAWGCLRHVEEALVSKSSVFVADEGLGGVAAYRARTHRIA